LGVNPTVRSLTDRLESVKHRSERWTDGEVAGVLSRLKVHELVSSEKDSEGKVRYTAKEVS
jgi:hypothetical protein